VWHRRATRPGGGRPQRRREGRPEAAGTTVASGRWPVPAAAGWGVKDHGGVGEAAGHGGIEEAARPGGVREGSGGEVARPDGVVKGGGCR
jgi:hypothetical protein